MKLEKEITVKVNSSYDELHRDLTNKNFKIVEKYQLNDIYLVHNEIDIDNTPIREILQSCILIRDIVDITKKLTYKYKKNSNNGEILEQGKVECIIENINDALKFFEYINYSKLLEIKDTCIIYTNNDIELAVQLVNDNYIFIEIEDKGEHTNKIYTDITDMKKDLLSLNLDCDYTNYFVRKAEIIFQENYKKLK